VRGDSRSHVATGLERKANLLGYLPVHLFSYVPITELYQSTYDDVMRETKIEWLRAVNVANLLWRKGYIQRLNILLEMLDLPSTDDREYIGRFVQNVRNRD
jgi:hypothetical protein